MNKLSILKKGIITENPVLVLLLGLCPALAVSTQATNALGMGVATTFVLLCSNIVISLVRNAIPDKVRIPCYIVLVAGFVVLAEMILAAYAYALHQALGIFLPLITVNCIIFARAELFAKRNNVLNSIIDAFAMGTGFTLALFILASIREIIGAGTWFGAAIPLIADFNFPLLTMAPGGFIVFAILIAIVNKISKGKNRQKQSGCAACPSAQACGKREAS